ncbi:WD domain-containing protein [Hortaea werneckii]|nr:WD domain-containing protein [Hortaea werneckii]KAI7063285.1 WD domain-containing protein [Hortaea werneckii]KAI7216100.1 WD domain-containing protein [Hortaea werneckii]KAI7290953.1 WD domain-containing protein [Hortaea werneckii]KAI7382747.1 WD domain-containing protein [Hortaea werneckii]
MSKSADAGHFFQTTDALATSERKAAKAKNKHGDPIKLPSKLLAVHVDHGDNEAVYVAEAAGDVKRITLDTKEVKRISSTQTASAPLTCLATSSQTGCLYAGCWDKNIHVLPLPSSEGQKKEPTTSAITRLTGHTDFVKCLLTTSLQGQPILLSGGADTTLIVWDLTTGKPLHKLKGGHVKAVQDLAIDPLSLEDTPGSEPSFILFTASSSPEIRRWYVSRSTAYELPESLESPIRAHDTSVYKLRFDSDGDLWTASADKTAKHLVRSRGWEVDTSLPHPDFVRDVVVHEEAGLVATACRDEEVRVWDAAGSEGEVVVTYSGHFEEVTGLGLVDGGRGVVSVSIDGTARKWSLERKGIAAFLEEVQREKSGDGQVKSEKEKEGMLTAEEEAELAELMDDDD